MKSKAISFLNPLTGESFPVTLMRELYPWKARKSKCAVPEIGIAMDYNRKPAYWLMQDKKRKLIGLMIPFGGVVIRFRGKVKGALYMAETIKDFPKWE